MNHIEVVDAAHLIHLIVPNPEDTFLEGTFMILKMGPGEAQYQYVYPLNVKESHQTPPRSGSGRLKGKDWNRASRHKRNKNCSAEGCFLVVGLMKERIRLLPFVRIRTCFFVKPTNGSPNILTNYKADWALYHKAVIKRVVLDIQSMDKIPG